MEPGEKVRLIGSAGAPLLVTVGRPFSWTEIERRLASGEWRRPGDAAPPRAEPRTAPAPPAAVQEPGEAPAAASETSVPAPDPQRPAQAAPKAEWVAYVARTQHMSREDAANYTKADLIDMVS